MFEVTPYPNEILKRMRENSAVSVKLPARYDLVVRQNVADEAGAFFKSRFARDPFVAPVEPLEDHAASCVGIVITEQSGWSRYEISLDPNRPAFHVEPILSRERFDLRFIDAELRLPVGVSLMIEATSAHHGSLEVIGVEQACLHCSMAITIDIESCPNGELHIYDEFRDEIAAFMGLTSIGYTPPRWPLGQSRYIEPGTIGVNVGGLMVFQPSKLTLTPGSRTNRGFLGQGGPSLGD